MKRLIEILDYEQTENIISPLVFGFDEIVYLYDQHHDDPRKRRTLDALLRKKGFHHVTFLKVDHLQTHLFDELIQKYPDSIFNLSNGSRTLLVKLSQYCEKTNQRCFTLNFQRKSFCNLYGCEELEQQFHVPHLNIQDMIELSSGEIIKTAHALPQLNEELICDMKKVIHIMNKYTMSWTKLLNVFAKKLKNREEREKDFFMEWPDEKEQCILLDELERAGILCLFDYNSKVHVVFKNASIMNLMSDSGAWLEYQSYLECIDSSYFDDVRISTVIDWNKESNNRNDPTCEIDLIVIKNCVPVFVSCKMNKCSALDLYEIKLLSQKLGGTLGKAAVISKAYALKKGEPLYLKAQELDITIISDQDIEQGTIADVLLDAIQ